MRKWRIIKLVHDSVDHIRSHGRIVRELKLQRQLQLYVSETLNSYVKTQNIHILIYIILESSYVLQYG
jgi:hypothetical protein